MGELSKCDNSLIKKTSIPLLFALIITLFISNSPVALYPELYDDYELINESVQIIGENLSKYIVIRGDIK